MELDKWLEMINGTKIKLYDELDFEPSPEVERAIKVIMDKLGQTSHKIILVSTPNENHGFFYRQMMESL